MAPVIVVIDRMRYDQLRDEHFAIGWQLNRPESGARVTVVSRGSEHMEGICAVVSDAVSPTCSYFILKRVS